MTLFKKYVGIIFLISFFLNSYAKPTIVLDPGHEPVRYGATGTCQKKEVEYNDELVMTLTKVLAKPYHIILTRQPGKNMEINASLFPFANDPSIPAIKKGLLARSTIANTNNAQLFISIHHDSTSEIYQLSHPTICEGRKGKVLTQAFKNTYQIGFNIFIYDDPIGNKIKTQNARHLAELIGKALLALDRTPSNYHFYPVDSCRSCRPVNKNLGIWHQDLAVLRNTHMPAILIEVGNIIDTEDEAKINNDHFRQKFSKAIQSAIKLYFASHNLAHVNDE